MKINARRLYTHPVLAEGRDDYATCKFSVGINYNVAASNKLVVTVNFSTDCAEIKQLVGEGKAKYLLHVECPLTCYRKIFPSANENFSCEIPLGSVKKNLDCLALIVLVEDTKDFSCKDWNEDFERLNFNLPHGTVLAYQNFQPLPIADDPNIFKNVASIFSIYKKSDNTAHFEIQLHHNKIKIGLNEKDFQLYMRYRSRPDMQPILNAMIIFPALVYVFEELKADTDFENYGGKDWFRSLKKAFKRKKIDILDEENTSIKLAQEVMDSPVTKALENLTLICDDATEDS